MPKKADNGNETMQEKLEYIGLDMRTIPDFVKNYRPIKFKIPRCDDETQYKQYKYISIKDIQILLSPTNRLDPIEDKYRKATPLINYLDSESEENFVRHTTFLNMLRQVRIKDIEKVSEEQAELNKKIPLRVKFRGNYLWQIYYSEITNQYFMLVPTEDTDYSTFFYLLKRQLEMRKNGKIFVPIRNTEYSSEFLNKTEFSDIENYIWLFTKVWPLIYEVYDKEDRLSIHIMGETDVYGKIRSPYKIELRSQAEAKQFYKLLKAMFILQTELPHYFEFTTNIDEKGRIEFYREDVKVEYANIANWINEAYYDGEEQEKNTTEKLFSSKEKLENLKIEIKQQEIEYLSKEKQISTFLECKKTFFGKFKYYFKYSGKGNKNKQDIKSTNINKNPSKKHIEHPIITKRKKKENYTIEDLVDLYRNIERKENELKNVILDINSLKLKNKNMKKKLENATAFIREIDSHKKSIFEFWKYSNKDEVASLPEGEAEEVNVIKKITKVFDYEEDIEEFGKTLDEIQRKALTKDETDGVYIATTNALEILNKVNNNTITLREIENSLREIKKQAMEEKSLADDEEFDIFGGIVQDNTKISKINNKKHRESPKNKYDILEINRNTNQIGYKLCLKKVIEDIKTALTKVTIPEDLSVYKAISGDELNLQEINLFNINPEKEIKQVLRSYESDINFYKINLKEGTNAVSCTNIIYYDNQNRTLPLGQDLSTNILIDTSKMNLKLQKKSIFKIAEYENERDDFSSMSIKTIHIFEYDMEEGTGDVL